MPLVKDTTTVDNLDVEVRKLKVVTVISGQSVVRGEVMQKTGQFTAGTATADGGNTGGDTFSAVTTADTTIAGTYIVEALTATTYKVIAPNGIALDAIATAGSAYSDQLGFTITTAGATTVAGDFYTVVVTVGLGKQTSFITGSVPSTVMAEDVDASAGDVNGWAFRDADIKASEVDFGTGTDAEVRDALDSIAIFLMD